MVANKGYEFHYRTSTEEEDKESCKKRTLIYVFKSRTNRRYIVLIEEFHNDIYAIKYYPKDYAESRQRFNIRTHDHDARKVIKTVVDIGKHILDKNNLASFVFIGSPISDEIKNSQSPMDNTKRYRVYKSFASYYFSDDAFEHKYNVSKSSYFMLNRNKKVICPTVEQDVFKMFNEYYNLDTLYQQMISGV